MLKINNLTKYYGKIKGVENLKLEIKKGEIFGFIGPNGAGKSTTIRCIMNIINKTQGEIFVDGILDTKEDAKLKEIIGYLPSEIHLYDDLKVKEIIEYSNSFYKKDCTKRASEIVKRLDLDVNKKIEELSLGNLKKVGIVLSLMHEPKLLILDEATSGLDPLMQEEFYKILLEEKKKGTTVFFSSHILSEIKKICDRVGIIKEGKLIKVESVKKLIDNSLDIVTVKTRDIDKVEKEFSDTVISKENDELRFMNKKTTKELLSILSKYDIDKLLIEEPSLEEIFMHYYSKEV